MNRSIRFRRSSNRDLSSIIPPRATDLRQRGRGEQLRSGSLHPRQGDHRSGPRQNSQDRRHVHQSPRFPDIPRVRRWYRFRIHQPADGASLHGLRQEGQARVRHLSLAANLHRGGWTLQRYLDHAHDARAFGLRVPRGQRGDLRHLQAKFRHRKANVHELEQINRADSIVHHGLVEVRRGVERGSDGVPDESSPVP